MQSRAKEWDVEKFREINTWEGTFARFLNVFTHFGGHQAWGLVFVGIVGLALLTKEPVAWTLVKLGFSNVWSVMVIYIVKARIHRPRPYKVLRNVKIRVSLRHARGHSFPSGHVQFHFSNMCLATLVLGPLSPVLPWILVPATVVTSILIAISRVHVGVHYPSDVIAGFGSGMLIFCITVLVTYPIWNHIFALVRALFP